MPQYFYAVIRGTWDLIITPVALYIQCSEWIRHLVEWFIR